MELAFLGGAGGVGASCLALDIAGRRVLIDAGVRMDPTADRLPDLAQLDRRDLAAIFVTHAHADHIGALPLVHQHFPATPIYASPATIRLMEVMLADGSLGRVVDVESRHDRWRPEVRQRWRESAGPGAGLWFDLGPHLLDQAVQLFGPPRAIALERALVRDGALADDWFHASLRYDRLHVHLRASMLASAGAPRWTLHGTRGSFVKDGLDAQEDALKAGVRPTWPARADWGVDPGRAAIVTRGDDGRAVETRVLLERGAHQAYFAAVGAAIRGEAPNPVPPEQALAVMELIELGIASAVERRELEWRIGDAPAR